MPKFIDFSVVKGSLSAVALPIDRILNISQYEDEEEDREEHKLFCTVETLDKVYVTEESFEVLLKKLRG